MTAFFYHHKYSSYTHYFGNKFSNYDIRFESKLNVVFYKKRPNENTIKFFKEKKILQLLWSILHYIYILSMCRCIHHIHIFLNTFPSDKNSSGVELRDTPCVYSFRCLFFLSVFMHFHIITFNLKHPIQQRAGRDIERHRNELFKRSN